MRRASSRWFQQFLNGRPGYQDFFVAFTTRDAIDPDYLRLILRPRTSDLLTPFRTINGVRFVWTTFSPDQVDLNFRSPTRAAACRRDSARLRAAWCGRAPARRRDLHLAGARHHVARTCARRMRWWSCSARFSTSSRRGWRLITETNVPHADNISYFGNGVDEAQLVYNFALPPLVLHTFHTGSCESSRAGRPRSTPFPTPPTTSTSSSSHDGVGLLGARGILTDEEVGALVDRTIAHGGFVSYRSNGDGTQSPYELNITWYSALNREGSGESQGLQVARFLAARAIALALRGVAGIYLPTLFGAKNDTEAVLGGAEKRTINRRTYDEARLDAPAQRPGLLGVAGGAGHAPADPAPDRAAGLPSQRGQEVLEFGPAVFALLRERAGVQRLHRADQRHRHAGARGDSRRTRGRRAYCGATCCRGRGTRPMKASCPSPCARMAWPGSPWCRSGHDTRDA